MPADAPVFGNVPTKEKSIKGLERSLFLKQGIHLKQRKELCLFPLVAKDPFALLRVLPCPRSLLKILGFRRLLRNQGLGFRV